MRQPGLGLLTLLAVGTLALWGLAFSSTSHASAAFRIAGPTHPIEPGHGGIGTGPYLADVSASEA